MSHLSILPTVLRDAECLAHSLEDLGYTPVWGGALSGFASDSEPVVLQVSVAAERLGWRRQDDGTLALVADLQRLSRSTSVQRLLSRLTRTYAARLALRQIDADPSLAAAQVVVSR